MNLNGFSYYTELHENNYLTNAAKLAVLPFEILESFGVCGGYERSFKLKQGRILANRYLIGVNKTELSRGAWLRICEQLGMPVDFVESFKRNFPNANSILIGFEDGEEAGCRFKIYLEYWDQICDGVRKRGKPAVGSRELMFLGYKWQADHPTGQTIEKYWCYPLLSIREIVDRIGFLFAGRDITLASLMQRITHRAAGRCGEGSFIYLEVDEGDNRTSFDLNVYKSNLTMIEIKNTIRSIANHFAISSLEQQQLLNLFSKARLGHLSAGYRSDNQEFASVYFEPCSL